MCGIAGIVSHTRPAEWHRMRGALDRLTHRGPDGEGIAGIRFDDSVTSTEDHTTRVLFGFRRLAIFDPTAQADQPMRCPVTGNLLVFNGAIYNFPELREELHALGHNFTSDGDAEVILAAYRAWGEEALPRFNGIWALALYDAASGEVLLSRDRLGVKPLYYKQEGERFLFASEIRALVQLLGHTPAIHAPMAFDFLAGSMIDHTEETLWEGIRQLPAGAIWRMARDGTFACRQYHHWPEETQYHTAEQVQRLLEDATRLRLRADAPVASLLSGGLDSSAITWFAAQHRQQPRTQFSGAFSYSYADTAYAAYDETTRAKNLIAALPEPVPHHVLQANPVPSIDELLALTVAQEQPSSTPSILASWRLYRHIRAQGIKVVLSGEGADELFGGYTRLYLPLLARDCLRQGKIGAFCALVRSPQMNLSGLARRLAWGLPLPVLMPLLQHFRPNIASLQPGFRHAYRRRFAGIVAQHAQPLAARLRQDVVQHGLPQILRYADRNSMAAGIEVRAPFLDYRLVELALSTAPSRHVTAAGGKQLLRRALRSHLPDDVLAQPKTHGLGHAEQYQLHRLDHAALLDHAPREVWEYIDRDTLAAQLQCPSPHTNAWLPLSFLLWITARAEGMFA